MLSKIGRFFRRRLFAKYIFLTLLVGGLLNFVILTLYWDRERTVQTSRVATEIATLSNAIARPVSVLLDRGDTREARNLLAVFSGYPHIICADFYAAESAEPVVSWPVVGCARIKRPGTRAEVPLAVLAPGAKMVVRLDDAQLRKDLNADMAVILVIGLFGGLALLVSGASAFGLFIGRPLKKLVHAIDTFERQNSPTKVNHTSEDEVGRVIDSYNQLLDREAERVGALREAHRQTMESVAYATRIQNAIMPGDGECNRTFGAFGKIWRPRDVVGGDMYWLRRSGNITTLALIDCTGHGVPGGFMTMIAAASLDRVYQDEPTISPARALARLSDLTRSVLGQGQERAQSNDGMDAAIVEFDADTESAVFAAAQLSVLVETATGFQRIRGNRVSLGYQDTEKNPTLTEHEIDLRDDPLIVLMTDGIVDQIGASRKIAFGFRSILTTLDETRSDGINAMLDALSTRLAQHAGSETQRDDLTVLALRAPRPAG